MMLLSCQSTYHLIHKIIYIDKLQLCRRIIDLNRKPVGHVMAERSHSGIIIRPAPFSEKIRETVDKDPRPRTLSIFKEKFLSCLLALSIFTVGIPACESGLDLA
jgi:hypothetical protein